jgi:hypothetical protein
MVQGIQEELEKYISKVVDLAPLRSRRNSKDSKLAPNDFDNMDLVELSRLTATSIEKLPDSKVCFSYILKAKVLN